MARPPLTTLSSHLAWANFQDTGSQARLTLASSPREALFTLLQGEPNALKFVTGPKDETSKRPEVLNNMLSIPEGGGGYSRRWL